MEQDNRTSKELIMAILQKCKEALPQLALLTKHIDKLSHQQTSPTQKVRKKDCLNPTFLIRLSQCGQNIRLILQHALSMQFVGKDVLKRYYNQYMQVIYDIRKYHEEAHNSYDMHKNSTQMKSNLLRQLQQQTCRRQTLEHQIQQLMQNHKKKVLLLNLKLQEWEERNGDRDDINISHISKISKKFGRQIGQLYGGDQKIGRIQQEYQQGNQVNSLTRKIKKLEAQLLDKEEKHVKELEYHKQGILELEGKFEQLMNCNSHEQSHMKQKGEVSEDHYRMLAIQAVTIEEFLNQDHSQPSSL